MKTFLSKITKSPNQIAKPPNRPIVQSPNRPIVQFLLLLLSLSPLLLLSLSASAQYYDVTYPGKGYPVMLLYYDGEQFQRYMVPDLDEQPVVRVQGKEATYEFDLRSLQKSNIMNSSGNRSIMPELYDPGIPVEGDLPSAAEWSGDGSIFAYVYQCSDNIIFYDANTFAILASVQVGRKPVAMKLSTNYAYICCYISQEIYVISLEDFSVLNIIPVDGTPCQIEVNPDETTGFIACNSFMDGKIIAVNLNTSQVVYEITEPYIHHYGFSGTWGRSLYTFTGFKLSPDGSKIITQYDETQRPVVIDALTGQVEKIFLFGYWRGGGFSPSGNTIYIYSVLPDDTVMMHRINTADYSVIDSIKSQAACDFGLVDWSDLAISGDGSRVLTNDHQNDRYCLFDFNTGSCQLTEAVLLYLKSPLYTSGNGDYAISFTARNVKFVNFETGHVYSSYPAGAYTGIPACASPMENKVIVSNLPFYNFTGNGNESIFSINFNDINNITLDTAMVCGEIPEVDVTTQAILTNDGEKLLSSGLLTHNLSIIDLDERNVDTVIYFQNMTSVKTIPGTNLALIFGQVATSTLIISLDNYETVAELAAGYIDEAYVTSNGQTGYLVDYMSNHTAQIVKIAIDGSSSTILNQSNIGYSSVYYHLAFGEFDQWSTCSLSPDDQFLLFGYDDPVNGPVLNIVSAETLELITSVRIPDYGIYNFTYTDDAKRVILSSTSNQVPIIFLDGANSLVENVFYTAGDSYSAAYNPIDRLFYVLNYQQYYYKVDPFTGNILETINTGYDDWQWRIAIDQKGIPLILTSVSMIYNGESYPMPGISNNLNYDEEYNLFISAVPGPDVICVFDPKMVGIQQFKPGKDQDISIFPNPATEQIFIRSSSEITRVKVCNIAGTEVISGDFSEKDIDIPTGNLAPGVYVIEVKTKQESYSRKMVVRK